MRKTCVKNINMKGLLIWMAMTMALVFDVYGQFAPVAARDEADDGILKVNWEKFLAKHDLVWDNLPEKWYQAPFTGNGMLGMLVYKDGPQTVRIDVGRGDVEDHRTGDQWHDHPRLRIGYFTLDTLGAIRAGQTRLDLWNAEARGTVETSSGKIQWRALTHSDQMVMIFEVTATQGEQGAKFTWHPLEAISPAMSQARRNVAAGSKAGLWVNWAKMDYPSPPNWVLEKQADVNVCRQPLLEGGEYSTAWKIVDKGSGHRILYASIAQSYPEATSSQEAFAAVKKAVNVSLGTLVKSHRAWWHGYYPESFITLPDERWEGFYWIQMYKLASATRADRMLIDNQGPWMEDTTWANAWFDLNVQLTYSCVPDSGRYEIGESLYNKIDAHSQQLIDNMPANLKGDSAGVDTIVNQDLVSHYTEIGIGDLPWALQNYYMYYRRTMDDRRLREHFFPILKRAINTYYHVLKEGPDGRLHLPPTYSPEYGNAPDCNYDLALIRWGCQTLLDICARLNINDPLIPKWKETLVKLVDYPVDENGFMVGTGMPFARAHRHYSHLLMIYPLYLVNADQPGATELIRKSLNHWLGFKGGKTGYTWTGASSMWSAIGDGNKALECLNTFEGYVQCNTMYKEAPESNPVVETPFSGAQSLHNMLLQSWGGTLRIFPAVPDMWKDAAFHNLHAEGGFLVSASRKNRQTEFVRVKSLAGEPCRIKVAWTGVINVKGVNASVLKNLGNGIVELSLRKGEEAFLYPGNVRPKELIAPVDGDGKFNYWGQERSFVSQE
jgi:alpha-L-fucosidase 2